MLDVGRDNLPITDEANRTWPNTLAIRMPITPPERPERWFASQAGPPKASAAAAPSAMINERTPEARKRRSLMRPCRAERSPTIAATAKASRPSTGSTMLSTVLSVDGSWTSNGALSGRGERTPAVRSNVRFGGYRIRGLSPHPHGRYGASERGASGSCLSRDSRYCRQPRRNSGHVGTVGSGSVFSGRRPQSAG